MASINISEKDFEVLADAAMRAKDRGDMEAAHDLDKLARKVNASLSNATGAKYKMPGMPLPRGLKWEEVPSTLI